LTRLKLNHQPTQGIVMALIPLAISILWLAIGVIIILGCVWLFFKAVESFGYVMPANIKNGIFLIILILIVIVALGMLSGGGSSIGSSIRLR
jgi:polyferredoxin